MSKPTLLLDFDGVLHTYDGTFTPHLNVPLPGARKACLILAKTYHLVCFTTRKPVEDIEVWLKRHGFPPMEVTDVKKAAFAIVDDRSLTFRGVWDDPFLSQIYSFTPWWKPPT